MPSSSLRPCSYPGCNTLVKTGRCDKHQYVSQPYARDPDRQALYDREWRERRAAWLAEHPWCEWCLERGIFKPATDVHHVIPHRGDKLIFVSSPLESLCHVCHTIHTGKEARGKTDDYYPAIVRPLGIPLFMICGAPASGKTSFVEKNYISGDLVIDVDVILSQLTGHALYCPDDWASIEAALRVRNRILESLQDTRDDGRRAWFIVTAGSTNERRIWKELLSPKVVYIICCNEEECIRRIDNDLRRSGVQVAQKEAVRRWWMKFDPQPNEIIVSTDVDAPHLENVLVGGCTAAGAGRRVKNSPIETGI